VNYARLEVFMVTGNEEILVGQLRRFFYSKLKQLSAQDDFIISSRNLYHTIASSKRIRLVLRFGPVTIHL
jgi:hypothetical protein